MTSHIVSFKDSLKSPTDTENQSSSDESDNGADLHQFPFKLSEPVVELSKVQEREESFETIKKVKD